MAESAIDGSCFVVNVDQIVDNRIVRNALETHDSAAATIALLQRRRVNDYGGVLVVVVDSVTCIGVNARVVECVAGTSVTISAGSAISGGAGDVRVKDRVFENEDHGALLADRVHDRGGVTSVPGILVGPNADVRTGATVRGTADGTEVQS